MKKYLLIALAALALTGCKTEDEFDRDATRKQAVEECIRYGGEGVTFWLSNRVEGSPWTVNCINKNTGTEFKVYIEGVPKK